MGKAWITPPAPCGFAGAAMLFGWMFECAGTRVPGHGDFVAYAQEFRAAAGPADFSPPRREQFRLSAVRSFRVPGVSSFPAAIPILIGEGQLPGTSAGSTSPIRRQPVDSSHVRGDATSGSRPASA